MIQRPWVSAFAASKHVLCAMMIKVFQANEDSLVHSIFSTSPYEDSLFLVSGVTVSAIWPQVIGRRLDPIMRSWQGVVSQWFHKWAGFDDWHFYSSRHVKVLFGACWQQKNVHFVKLSKCETVFTIAFLSSRRSRNIYGMSNSESRLKMAMGTHDPIPNGYLLH